MATLTIEQFKQKLKKQEKQMLILIDDTLPKLVGVEAISHFSENFQNEGFDGRKWKEVKRRESDWTRGADKTRKILTGRTGNLGRSLYKQVEKGKVTIISDLIYAPVHNEGLRAGRGSGFLMPKRQFIGESRKLDAKVLKLIKNRIKYLLS